MKKTSFLFTSVSSISFILKLNLILLIKLALSRDSLFNIIFKEFVSLAGKDMIPYTSGILNRKKILDDIVTGWLQCPLCSLWTWQSTKCPLEYLTSYKSKQIVNYSIIYYYIVNCVNLKVNNFHVTAQW